MSRPTLKTLARELGLSVTTVSRALKETDDVSADTIALVKQKGDKASYGAPTNLALAAGSLFNERLGLKAVAVPYKSTPEGLNDLNNGFIDYIWSDATFALGQMRQGRMRVSR